MKEEKVVYFLKSIPITPKSIHEFIAKTWSPTKKLVFSALMVATAALLQSAGGFIPVFGFFISPFTTLPILLCMLISNRHGVIAYLLTICLLFLIEPSELFIFPFTTGLLGLSIGWGFRKLNKRLAIIGLGGGVLFLGICFPLYVLGFPVFGPITSSAFNVQIISTIFLFSILYSSLWLELGLFFGRRLEKVITDSN